MHPHRTKTTLIKESLSSLSTKSAYFRDIITDHHEARTKLSLILDKYDDFREEILSEQAWIHDLIERHRRALSSPIRKLPIDIMREIFILVSSNVADIKDFAWTATHTCSEWRAIAVQTPTLCLIEMPEIQSLLSISKGASNKECVRRALELSGHVPLVVFFVQPDNFWKDQGLSDADVEMIDMLLDHAPRWKIAYLDAQWGGPLFNDRLHRLRGRVPMLERVSIEASFDTSGSPHLQDILALAPRLSTVAIHDYLGQLVFSWKQVRRLILHGLHEISYFLRVLRSVKNVEHLTICPKGGPIGLPSDTTDGGSSIILPTIHTLDLLSDMNSLFLPPRIRIILPVLKNLHVGRMDLDSWRFAVSLRFMDTVRGLLRNSGCVLTHATFLPIVEFGPAFQEVIVLCSNLTYLNVGFIPPRENIDRVFSFMNQQNVLPALQTLKITFRGCNLSDDGLCIGQRLVETALVRRDSLRVFETSVHVGEYQNPPPTNIISAMGKALLERFKAEGMSITVRVTADGTRWKQSLEFA
ncbi:hypothetical protein EV421DRAFT_1987444 [Armillaria borealis]|uniref:F-box domain-containing protein n=1 Tax=Armillaria borealis TaxID=47425 RepID=A0AA39MI91_9AGAR|nr:hypothetical protein EV421DRAFT_1987444 [Armillaria borealis]